MFHTLMEQLDERRKIMSSSYFINLAACNPTALTSRSFVLGNEAPDLLKKWNKQWGIIKTQEKYNQLRRPDMPQFSELQERIQQKERWSYDEGLHYGKGNNPHVVSCWNSLTPAQKESPFWRGYLWHLLTDKYVLSELDVEGKLEKVMSNYCGSQNDKDKFLKREVAELEKDWGRCNSLIRDTFPTLRITPEIIEMDMIQFMGDSPIYVDWYTLRSAIRYLRSFNPMEDNIPKVIHEVLG